MWDLPPPPDYPPVTWDNSILLRLKDGGLPNFECITYQHFQLNQTWRIIHLLLVYTRKLQRLMLIFFYSLII